MGQQVYETNRRNHWGKDFCVYPLPHLSAGLFRMLSFGKSQPSMKVSTSVKRGHHFLTGDGEEVTVLTGRGDSDS